MYKNQLEHDPSNQVEAMSIAQREDCIPIGLFFQDEARPRYSDMTIVGLDMPPEKKLHAINQELDRIAV